MHTTLAKNKEQDPACDPASERYVPNDPRNRKSVDPHRARHEGPGYAIDSLGVAFFSQLAPRRTDEHDIIIRLVDCTSDPTFHLEGVCRTCETWKPTHSRRPYRKGAEQPEDSCFGCALSFLDGNPGRAFSSTDRDAAYSEWASARAKVAQLERERALANGERQIERLKRQLTKATELLRRASHRCKRLGFKPSARMGGSVAIAEHLREMTAAPTLDCAGAAPEFKCGNCSAWSYDESLSDGKKESRGYCWSRDGEHTKESFWCFDHKPDGGVSLSEFVSRPPGG